MVIGEFQYRYFPIDSSVFAYYFVLNILMVHRIAFLSTETKKVKTLKGVSEYQQNWIMNLDDNEVSVSPENIRGYEYI